MPSSSKAQHNFMAKAMNDPKFAAKHGIEPRQAAEFVHAGKGKVKAMPAKASSAIKMEKM